MPDTLSITDNRTGKTYEVPIEDGTIKALDLRKIKTDEEDFGLMAYDPGFMNTAACKSRITFIDGDKGILRYRGYPIEQLAEQSDFLEVAYLLYFGELPTRSQLDDFKRTVLSHTIIHEQTKKFIDGFRHDSHPMGAFLSTVAALSTFYREVKTSSTPRTASSSSNAWWPRCPPSPPSATATPSACRSRTPITTSATPATS